MNLFFDEDSQKLIISAKEEMLNLKHPYVGSEHLMLSILKNTELDITKTLNDCGLNYELFYSNLVDTVGIGSKTNNWFLFTPLLKRIINNAIYYSKDNDSSVTPLSLLICLLQEGDGVANRILISLNIDLDALCDKFIQSKNYSCFNKKLFLDEFAINMNDLVLSKKFDSIFGRNNEIEMLIRILLRKNKNNPLLIGEAGVGKTAIVEELARRIVIGDVPYKLKDKVIYNLPIYNIVSNTKYRGEFESRLKKIIDEITDNPNIILFIDEIHTIVGAGGAEGAIDASNIIKPYLARNDLKIIGATTINEYSKYIVGDKALSRRFQNIFINEPNSDETKNILLCIKKSYEKFHGVIINDDIISYLVDFSNKYLCEGKQPDKSIDLLDEVCTYSLSVNSDMNKLNKYDKDLNLIINYKNNEIVNKNFKKALYYRRKENLIRSNYNKLSLNISKNVIVEKKYLFDVIYFKTKIPVGDYFEKTFLELGKKLKRFIYSQDNVIDLFYNTLIKSNYIIKNSPISFLFVGKSGVGKTFFADKIADIIFDNDSFFKINMSDYKDEYSFYKMFRDNYHSFLYNVKHRPFSLIVFDNYDLCCFKLKKYISKVIYDGFFTTFNGERIDLSKCIIIMTSCIKNGYIGFNSDSNLDDNLDDNFINKLYFNDINKKDIVTYLKKKYCDYYFDDNLINHIFQDSKYLDFGFKLVDNVVKNTICLS